jgi:hypothetical protein
MADHSTTPSRTMPDETPERFLTDRQNFWAGFTQFPVWSVVSIGVLLILMAVFLL